MVNGLTFCLIALIPAVFAALPSGWKTCKRSSKDYDKCLTEAINHAISTLIDGNKKLGIISLDPLKIDTVEVPRHQGPVSISVLLNNVEAYGIKGLKLDSITTDWLTATGTASIPNFKILGNYKIDGNVLVLPIVGNGKCNITIDDLQLGIQVKFNTTKIKGKNHNLMEKLQLELKPKKAYIHLENLFNGDKALGDNMNKFINENWVAILEEFKPPLTETLSIVLSEIANRVLSRIPANEIDIN